MPHFPAREHRRTLSLKPPSLTCSTRQLGSQDACGEGSGVPLGAGGEELRVFAHADFTLLLLGGAGFFLGLLVGGRR